MLKKWNNRFMNLAQEISTWSKDPRKKIGAVAIDPDDRRILSTGYNGFPKEISDDIRLNDREIKSDYIIHAEANCIYNATFTGISLKGAYLYVFGLPVCNECAKAIMQVGIKKVFYSYDELAPEDLKWEQAFIKTRKMFDEANVGVEML